MSGSDARTGKVAVPVNDDSGALHHGTNLLFGAAPTYSADIPTAGTAPGQARNVTGVGSVAFSNTTACISTANSAMATHVSVSGPGRPQLKRTDRLRPVSDRSQAMSAGRWLSGMVASARNSVGTTCQ